MNEDMVDQHFHLLRNARKDFLVPSSQQPIHKRLLPRNLLNQWIHLVPYRIKTYRTVLNTTILTSSSNSSKENAVGILRQRDQSAALFKQKRWLKTKTNDRIASRLEMGI